MGREGCGMILAYDRTRAASAPEGGVHGQGRVLKREINHLSSQAYRIL